MAIHDDFGDIAESIRARMDVIDTTREFAYTESRQIVRDSAAAIRATHRGDGAMAAEALARTAEAVRVLLGRLAGEPILYGAGFVQDAIKEYVEAAVTSCLEAEAPLPSPVELRVPEAAYLNGVAEAVMEIRRHIVDEIRLERLSEAERKLERAEDIYHVLMSFDYPDAVALGLRRRLDTVRSVLERTRSDVVTAIRQASLERKMASLESRLSPSSLGD
ncbi:MAG TPA: haloacid dehalogenase [Armatimonadota bacterium]|nr:haloacid dehalogenase [Armatimonadota bacterium]HQK95421.1 haloacid dehalogenase [Armatimonadota bacterium]